jgi:Domain of unknown function DUF83
MALWKVYCEENKFPGMWQRWFQHQCVGIGWMPAKRYRLNGVSSGGYGWKRAREAVKSIKIGDGVIVTLRGHRVGRLGVVTGKAIEDDEWNPLVPESPNRPTGDMGRRIFVRWELTIGPDSRDMVVKFPTDVQFTPGALSGYIAAYPHKLEDGLLPHPDKRVREKVFSDNTRSDVLLEDRDGSPVVVECKQGNPAVDYLKQLRHYMKLLEKETRRSPRGILVHGGARKLSAEVAIAARQKPRLEIVRYSLDVDFARSD